MTHLSPWSASKEFLVAGAPTAPVVVSAQAVWASTSVTITWAAAATQALGAARVDGGSPLTYWKVQWRISGGTYADANASVAVGTLTYTKTGLTAGSTYDL